MALGCIGMSMDDFEGLSPEEFSEIFKSYSKQEDMRLHDAWERTRILATIVVQPHLKKKISAKELLPLLWDKQTSENVKKSTKEDFEKLVKQLETK